MEPKQIIPIGSEYVIVTTSINMVNNIGIKTETPKIKLIRVRSTLFIVHPILYICHNDVPFPKKLRNDILFLVRLHNRHICANPFHLCIYNYNKYSLQLTQ